MKKKHNIFTRLLFISFIVFLFLYILTKSGYYEMRLHEKVVLTDQKIKQFEEDIKTGKMISVDSYYVEEKPNYSSFVSKAGQVFSQKISNNIVNFFTNTGKILKKLFW